MGRFVRAVLRNPIHHIDCYSDQPLDNHRQSLDSGR